MAEEEEESKPAPKPKKQQSLGLAIVSKGTNVVVVLFIVYACFVANMFRTILYPKYPDVDPKTQEPVRKFDNIVKVGDNLTAKVWVATAAWPTKKAPLAEFRFTYDWDNFEQKSKKLNATITQAQLKKGTNVFLSVEVTHEKSGRVMRAKGGMVKQIKKPELKPKFGLLNGSVCPEPPEPDFGKRTHIGRGIPQMQVRLVYDLTPYPHYLVNSPYAPNLFVDEFWMTNEQLVLLNTTGANNFESEVHLGLMSAARWRFQHHMELSFEQTSKAFGEDSEEMLQMRDLFANTNPYLLTATLIVSVLHIVFEFLAFKNDVQFWQGCDPATLNKYLSVQSIAVGIVMQVLLLMYLWDESANLLVLASSLVGIVIDVWKVQRAMKVQCTWIGGVIPVPSLTSKVHVEKADDFDTIAMKWLTVLLSPTVVGYGIYTLYFDCHKGWYSYFVNVSASCVYSMGFVLMTPQVFINYKHKTVAYLPWKKFIYRALCTFIDDLFALIIRMPTMHRLSCFRDDIVFFIYLYQRHLYPVDKSRCFDEDGFMLSEEDTKAANDAAAGAEAKKDK